MEKPATLGFIQEHMCESDPFTSEHGVEERSKREIVPSMWDMQSWGPLGTPVKPSKPPWQKHW